MLFVGMLGSISLDSLLSVGSCHLQQLRIQVQLEFVKTSLIVSEHLSKREPKHACRYVWMNHFALIRSIIYWNLKESKTMKPWPFLGQHGNLRRQSCRETGTGFQTGLETTSLKCYFQHLSPLETSGPDAVPELLCCYLWNQNDPLAWHWPAWWTKLMKARVSLEKPGRTVNTADLPNRAVSYLGPGNKSGNHTHFFLKCVLYGMEKIILCCLQMWEAMWQKSSNSKNTLIANGAMCLQFKKRKWKIYVWFL